MSDLINELRHKLNSPPVDLLPCPACGMNQDGHVSEGYRHYECGSFGPAGFREIEKLNQSKACKRVAYMNQEYSSADKHGIELVKACEEFRDNVLHGIDQFDSDRTNAVLGLYDNIIGGKL